jgi:hypothetical protein
MYKHKKHKHLIGKSDRRTPQTHIHRRIIKMHVIYSLFYDIVDRAR